MNSEKNPIDYQSVGLQIRKIREGLNISQEELADKTGLSTGTIGKIERGENNPKIGTLIKIANELDIPCKEFFEIAESDWQHYSPQLQRLVQYAKKLNDEQVKALCYIAKTVTSSFPK